MKKDSLGELSLEKNDKWDWQPRKIQRRREKRRKKKDEKAKERWENISLSPPAVYISEENRVSRFKSKISSQACYNTSGTIMPCPIRGLESGAGESLRPSRQKESGSLSEGNVPCLSCPIRHRGVRCGIRLTKSVHSISPPSMAVNIAIKKGYGGD